MPPTPAMVVLDTNWVLDLLVFADPGTADLHQDLRARRVLWFASEGMRGELARVLAYPQLVQPLAKAGLQAPEVLARFDALSSPCPGAPTAALRCRDADDQPFIDLAVFHRCVLLSRDREVQRLAGPLKAFGVAVSAVWPIGGEVGNW